MAYSRARHLSKILLASGRVKRAASNWGDGSNAITLANLPTITNAKLDNSSLTINSVSTALGTSADENIQDLVGAMFTGNTETGVTVTYQDSDGTIDLVIGTLNQNTTGSAATLTTARTIGGVSFDGSTNINLPGVNTAGNQNTTGTAATVTTAAQPAITSVGTLTTLTVDDITINGSTISDAGAFTLDVGGDINLDADSGYFYLQDGGTSVGLFKLTSSDFYIKSVVNDKDLIFQGKDGSSTITALTLDMSDAGHASFNNHITAAGNIYTDGNVNLTVDGKKIRLGAGEDLEIYHDGSNSIISETGTGGLLLYTAGVATSGFYKIGGEEIATFEPDGPVTLYWNDSKKFETSSTGVTVTGIAVATSFTGNLTGDLLGTPNAPTAAANTNTTQVATTAYVQTELTDLINGAPGTLDTLNELAAAINDDANYNSTLTTALALKAPKASPTFTGTVTLPATVSGSITPASDSVYALGTDSVRFAAGYLDGLNVTNHVTAGGSSSSSVPIFKFEGDTNTGLGWIGADQVGLIAGGSRKFYVNATTAYFQNLSGGVNFTAPVTIGADDTGHDLRLYGATTSRYIEWDESLDTWFSRDNVKAVWGNANDLQIYHDGSNSHVRDAGTGNLKIRADNLQLMNSAASASYLETNSSTGVITLYHGTNSPKLATNSGGVTITGNITTSTTLSSFYDRIKIVNGSAQINIGQWDGTNHRIETDANRPFKIYSYNTSGGIALGISGSDKLTILGNGSGISVAGGITATGGLTATTGTFSGVGTFAGVLTGNRFINATNSNDPWIKGVNTSGTETCYIQQSGNAYFAGLVGVNKAVNTAVGLSVGSDASSSTSYGLEVCNSTSNTRFLVDGSGSQRFYGSDHSETARFTDGKLGIGHTVPESILHLRDTSSNAIVQTTWENDARKWRFGVHGGLSDSMNLYDETASASRFTVTSVGNVGIGTTTPYLGTNVTSLTVNAVSYPTLALKIGDVSKAVIMATSAGLDIYANDNKTLRLHTNDTPRLLVDGGGNIGIGTTPDDGWNSNFDVLQIGLSGVLYGYHANAQEVMCVGNNFNNVGASFVTADRINEGYAQQYLQDHGGYHVFRTTGSAAANSSITWVDAMCIDPGGNVGIGTATPTTFYEKALHIHESAGSSAIHLTNNTTGTTVNDGQDIICYGSDLYIWNREVGEIFFGTNATERMSLDGTGLTLKGQLNLPATGIIQLSTSWGTDKKLYLQGGATIAAEYNTTDGWITNVGGFKSAAGGTFTTASGNDLNLVYPSGRSLFIKEAGEIHVTVDNTGNVGIGTTTPKASLDIKQAGNVWEDGILLQHDNANTGWNIHAERTGSALWFGYNADTSVALTSQTATASMYLTSNGRVGIGHNVPDAKLDIKGTGGSTGKALEVSDSNNNQVFCVLDGGRVNVRYYPFIIGNDSGHSLASGTRFFLDGSAVDTYVEGTGQWCIGETGNVNGAYLTVSSNNGEGLTVGRPGSNAYRTYRHITSSGIHQFISSGNTASLSNAGAWTDASDIAIKKDIEDIGYGLETVQTLQPRKYKLKEDDSEQIGFIAQEMETIVPEVVIGEEGQKGISYGQITSILTKAIQELTTKLEAAEARIAALEA
jgi:hypothetical protein